METVTIQTSQNVEIEHNLASVGERMVATILDWAFIGSYITIISIIYSTIGGESTAFFIVMALPVLLYHLLFEIIFGGQSPGKMILRVKVVKIDGTQAGIGSYVIRWVLRLVDITMLSGTVALITVFVNGKGQRLGDIAAKTTVIKIDRKTSINETIHVKLPENYKVVYPQAANLSETDIYTVKETLEFYQRNRYRQNAVIIANKAKLAVQEKLEIESNMHPEQFFQVIIADYNYLHKEEEV